MQIKDKKYLLYIMVWLLIFNKLQLLVRELFIRGRKLNISFVFVKESYFAVPKQIRLNSARYFKQLIIHKILTLKTMNLCKNLL